MGHGSRLVALLLISFLSVLTGYGVGQGTDWGELAPPTAPSPRLGHAMAYDVESDRVILFGGETDPLSNVLNDETWAYDLDSNIWETRNPNSGPTPRFAHAMTYDVDSDRVILFGGWTGTEQNTETWAYNYNTNEWTEMSPATSPLAGVFVNMVYDVEADLVILFGGVMDRFLGGARGETWAYDFDANGWTRRNPNESPSPRAINGLMAYDTSVDRVVLFGGQDVGGNLGDTWEYDDNTNEWTETSPDTSPSPRHAGAMAHDNRTDLVILFGGQGVSAASDETWAYDADSDTWTRLGAGDGPSRRFGAAMAYDTKSESIILFGGSTGGGETWAARPPIPPDGFPLPWLLIAVGVVGGAVVVAVATSVFRKRRRGRK